MKESNTRKLKKKFVHVASIYENENTSKAFRAGYTQITTTTKGDFQVKATIVLIMWTRHIHTHTHSQKKYNNNKKKTFYFFLCVCEREMRTVHAIFLLINSTRKAPNNEWKLTLLAVFCSCNIGIMCGIMCSLSMK